MSNIAARKCPKYKARCSAVHPDSQSRRVWSAELRSRTNTVSLHPRVAPMWSGVLPLSSRSFTRSITASSSTRRVSSMRFRISLCLFSFASSNISICNLQIVKILWAQYPLIGKFEAKIPRWSVQINIISDFPPTLREVEAVIAASECRSQSSVPFERLGI